ncbi:hypothetical protein ABPG75_003421 [Micractinium tetrahymenae]
MGPWKRLQQPEGRRDPNAPKRPLSAYMFFAADKRKELKESQPDLKLGEIGKATGEAWKGLSDKDKAPYQKKADADKARYEKEKAAYEGGAPAKKAAPKKSKKEAAKEVEEEESEGEEEVPEESEGGDEEEEDDDEDDE